MYSYEAVSYTHLGQMTLFARRYSDYDEEGKELIAWVEVWDNKKMYRYRQDKRGIAGAINKVKQYFGIDVYKRQE